MTTTLKRNKYIAIAPAFSCFTGMVSVALGLASVHVKCPTFFTELYYTLTDPITTTSTEQRIEERFGIDYEGDSDETQQQVLEGHLSTIEGTNPALLADCQKIVLYSDAAKSSSLVKPILDYDGLANAGEGVIDVLHNSLEIVVHEAAHLKHHHVPDEFNQKLDRIFGNSYGKDEIRNFWPDGTDGPRNGFVRAYGSNSPSENVATYVEKIYQPAFWKHPKLQRSEKYLQTIGLLHEYGFIPGRDHNQITAAIKNDQTIVAAMTE